MRGAWCARYIHMDMDRHGRGHGRGHGLCGHAVHLQATATGREGHLCALGRACQVAAAAVKARVAQGHRMRACVPAGRRTVGQARKQALLEFLDHLGVPAARLERVTERRDHLGGTDAVGHLENIVAVVVLTDCVHLDRAFRAHAELTEGAAATLLLEADAGARLLEHGGAHGAERTEDHRGREPHGDEAQGPRDGASGHLICAPQSKAP